MTAITGELELEKAEWLLKPISILGEFMGDNEDS